MPTKRRSASESASRQAIPRSAPSNSVSFCENGCPGADTNSVCAIHKSSCFSRCLRVPIAMRRFYEQTLWIPQNFPPTNPDLHHGLLAGDWGTGTDEARIVAAAMEKSEPDFTIHLGDVYYVGDNNEVRENFLGEKTSPYAPVKWPMGAKGSFALNGNHEMYADGNGYWKMVLPRM